MENVSRIHKVGMAGAALLLCAWSIAVPQAAEPSGTPQAAAGGTLAQQASGAVPIMNLTQYVNPFVGTANGGDTFPGADYPFGMVQWSPSTENPPPGGYNYGDPTITGFSLTHLSGAGCPIYGDFPFIPFVGSVTQSPVSDPSAYAMPFSHGNEKATPGYYRVKLNSGITVKLTVTRRTGYGEFSFPTGAVRSLLLNAGGSANGDSAASIQVVGDHMLEGSATSGSFCGSHDVYTVYFAAIFKQAFTAHGTWDGKSLTAGSDEAAGKQSGAYVSFASGMGPIQVRVGLSFVSEQGALDNLRAEDPTWGFSGVRNATESEWNRMLNRIQVHGGTLAEKQNFYTALYHTLLFPSTFSDANGEYMGFDDRIHSDDGKTQYANFSGWDIFRSEMPLLAFLFPHRASNMIQSLVRDGEQGGRLPRWPLAAGYTGVMQGDSADNIISEAYALGARQFDTRLALKLMLIGANDPGCLPNGYDERPGLESFNSLGYVACSAPGGYSDGASQTLEYATDDAAIGLFAKALGESPAVVARCEERANNWQNVFCPSTGLVQPRSASGIFAMNVGAESQEDYLEGTADQYRWMVPQDLPGLIAALGGPEAVVAKLNRYFTHLNQPSGTPYAWMGNEPSIGDPWIYDFADDPSGTEKVVRRVVNRLYQPTPGGLDGNDDLGTMAAWYVWASLGMYPEIPGVAGFALASPLFPSATIYRGNGQRLTITGIGAAADSPYVESVTADGERVGRSWLSLSSISRLPSNQLVYRLAPSPVAQAAVTAGHAPEPLSIRDGAGAPSSTAALPAVTEGLQEALPAASTPTVDLGPGEGTSLSFGLQSLLAGPSTYDWHVSAPTQLRLGSHTGVVHVGPYGIFALNIPVHSASTAPPGIYRVVVTFSGGAATAGAAAERIAVREQILVVGPGSLLNYYNNIGITSASTESVGSFDGGNSSYSQSLLAAAGIHAGSVIDVDGAHVVWPHIAPGLPDNVEADGQVIPISGSGDALVFVGAASNGPSVGTGTITYASGEVQSYSLGFTDWTRNGGGSAISYGNTVVAQTPARNVFSGTSGRQQVVTYLYAESVPLLSGQTVVSVTLPGQANEGQLHVFALAFSGGAQSVLAVSG